DPFACLLPQGVVDVEARADVDALRRLLGEDDLHVAAEERSRQRDLLLVAAGKRLHRLLDRGRTNAQTAPEPVDRLPLAAAPQQAESHQAVQDLDGRDRKSVV